MTKIIKVDPGCKEGWKGCFEQISAVVNSGGLIAYPTETFYGLGCDGFNTSSINKIFKLKERSLNKPLLLLISHMRELPPLINGIPAQGERLMEIFWPGPLTIIFQASEKIPAILSSGTGKIGIRIPGLEFTRAMIEQIGLPLVGTSANISGKPGFPDIEDIRKDFGGGVDLYLDGGQLEPDSPSTVVDMTGNKPVVIREGRIKKNQLAIR